jgi:hypothetical protein
MAYVRRYFFGAQRPRGCHCFFVSIEEIDTVGADAEVALEIPADGRTQRIVQVSEYKAGYLFAGSVG